MDIGFFSFLFFFFVLLCFALSHPPLPGEDVQIFASRHLFGFLQTQLVGQVLQLLHFGHQLGGRVLGELSDKGEVVFVHLLRDDRGVGRNFRGA